MIVKAYNYIRIYKHNAHNLPVEFVSQAIQSNCHLDITQRSTHVTILSVPKSYRPPTLFNSTLTTLPSTPTMPAKKSPLQKIVDSTVNTRHDATKGGTVRGELTTSAAQQGFANRSYDSAFDKMINEWKQKMNIDKK